MFGLSILGDALSGLLEDGNLGGLMEGITTGALNNATMQDIKGMAGFNPQNADFGAGSVNFMNGQGAFNESPQQQALRAMLGTGAGNQMAGGLFNDANFQSMFANNDMLGALNQSNAANSTQMGNTAFGGLGGTNSLMSQLMGGFGSQAAAGPQDLTGGLMGNMFSQGAANSTAAGDQSGLFNQSLQTQRDAATQGGLMDQAINKLQNRQFATGQLGSTGGAQQTSAFLDSIARQDLGFQNNAFGQSQQMMQALGNLGSQQMGMGSQLLGQNLGQFNQNTANAGLFAQLANATEGQGFGQMLQALGANQSAGNQRLQNAMNIFGQGANTFNQSFGQGLAANQGIQGMNQLGLESILGMMGAENARIAATGNHAQALGQMSQDNSGFLGGIVGGLFS